MFVHIGNNESLPLEKIIGIFDTSALNLADEIQAVKKSMTEARQEKKKDKIKSLIVTDEGVYFSVIMPKTLKRRLQAGFNAIGRTRGQDCGRQY